MLIGLGSCRKDPTNTSSSGIATIVCDDGFENIMNQEIDVFEYNCKGNANIIPYYVPEKACVDSLLDLKTKTIVITRELTEKEKAYLESQKKHPRSNRIAVDAIALIVNPQNYIGMVRDAGAALMNVHQEACVHLHRTICAIKDAGMKAAVTLNPSTPVEMLEDVIEDVDMVLLMSVNPEIH